MSVDVTIKGLLAGSIWKVKLKGVLIPDQQLKADSSGTIHFVWKTNNPISDYQFITSAGSFGSENLSITTSQVLQYGGSAGSLLSGAIVDKFVQSKFGNSSYYNYNVSITVPTIAANLASWEGRNHVVLNNTTRTLFDMGSEPYVYAVRELGAINILKNKYEILTEKWPGKPNNSSGLNAFLSSVDLLSKILAVLPIEKNFIDLKLVGYATNYRDIEFFNNSPGYNRLENNIENNFAIADSFYSRYKGKYKDFSDTVAKLNYDMKTALQSKPVNRETLYSGQWQTKYEQEMLNYAATINSYYNEFVELPKPWSQIAANKFTALMAKFGDKDPLLANGGKSAAYEFMQYYYYKEPGGALSATKGYVAGLLSNMTSNLSAAAVANLTAPNGNNCDSVLTSIDNYTTKLGNIMDFYNNPIGSTTSDGQTKYQSGSFYDQFAYHIAEMKYFGFDEKTINYLISSDSSWGKDVIINVSNTWFGNLTKIYNSAADELKSSISYAHKLQDEASHKNDWLSIVNWAVSVIAFSSFGLDIAAGIKDAYIKSSKLSAAWKKEGATNASVELEDLDSQAANAKFLSTRVKVGVVATVVAYNGWKTITDYTKTKKIYSKDEEGNALPQNFIDAQKNFRDEYQKFVNEYSAKADKHDPELTTLTFKRIQGYGETFKDASGADVSDKELYEIGVNDIVKFRKVLGSYHSPDLTSLYNTLGVPDFDKFDKASGQALPNVNVDKDFYSVWLDEGSLASYNNGSNYKINFHVAKLN